VFIVVDVVVVNFVIDSVRKLLDTPSHRKFKELFDLGKWQKNTNTIALLLTKRPAQ